MDASVPAFEKPHFRISVADWTNNIQTLQNEARIRRLESYGLRKGANQLRNETSVTTRWDNYTNNQLLRDRIYEVESWRDKQRFTRENVRDEIRALKEEKNTTELYLESLQIPLAVMMQCLSNRDQRVPSELTRDQLGEELKKELHIVENNKRVLTEICNAGWEKIKELTNALCRLEREIKNKDEAIALEYHVRELNRDSSGISYKIDPTRIPADSMTEESYEDCIKNTIKIAEQLVSESRTIRETMFRNRETTKNETHAQCQQVELVMRRRVYDIQKARNEMEWQKYKLEINLQKVDYEIQLLRDAVADKIDPTKLVETRLETRTRRPALERVQDKVLSGLLEEHERVNLSKSTLENKLEEAIATYHGMSNHYARVCKDLQYKDQALETDRRLIEIRKPIHFPGESDFVRNVGYCHMSQELVPE